MPKAEEFKAVDIEQVFTDRIEEQRLFNDLYNNLKKDDFEVIDFWGIPGIGKSSLCAQLQHEIERRGGKNHYISIDFHKSRKEEADYIEEIARKLQLKNNLFSFPILSVALSLYFYKLYGEKNRIKELEDNFANRHPLLAKMIKPAIATVGLIPALSSASTLVDTLIDALSGELKERMMAHKQELLLIENYSIQRVRQKLAYFFTIDYNKNMENETNPIVIFLDTYETYVSELACIGYEYKNDIWLRNRDMGIVPHCKNTIWVISGREKIVWDNLDDYWKGKIHFCELRDFVNDYSREYLEAIGIKDMTVMSRIIEASKGVPFHLYLSAEYYFQQKNNGISSDLINFGNDYEEIFGKYVEGLRDSDKIIVFIMACLGKWKKSIFLSSSFSKYVSDIFSLDKIHKLSFIKFDGIDTYYLHSEAEDILRRRCPKQIKDIFENYISKKSATCMLTEEETVEVHINRIRDELQSMYLVTELYHSEELGNVIREPNVLIQSYKNNKPILIKYLENREYSSFDALLTIYMQAYECTIDLVDEEKLVFVDVLRLAVKSFMAREWYSDAITTEDKIIKLISDISIIEKEVLFERYQKLSISIALPHDNSIIYEMENLYRECKGVLGMQNTISKGIRALYEYTQMVSELRYDIVVVKRFVKEEKRLYGENSPRGVKADMNVAYAYKLHGRYKESIEISKSLLGRMECWLDEYDIDYMHAIENLVVAYYRFGMQTTILKSELLFREGLTLSKKLYNIYKRKEMAGKVTSDDRRDFLGYVTRIIEGMSLMKDYEGGLEFCEEAMSDPYFLEADNYIKRWIYDTMACIKMKNREWRSAAMYVKKLYEIACVEEGAKSNRAIMLKKRYCELLKI